MGPLSAQRASASLAPTTGFTLVEMLVVLVVVGIAAGLIFLNVDNDPRRSMQREAKQLAGALEHAAALAQWRAETLGVSAEGQGYRFWRRGDSNRWIPIGDDEVLIAHWLPAGLTVTPASYAGTPVPPDAILPFRASGRNEPYALVLASPGSSVIVSGDPLNRVSFAVAANGPPAGQ